MSEEESEVGVNICTRVQKPSRQLEYCIQTWSPYLNQDIEKREERANRSQKGFGATTASELIKTDSKGVD